MAKTVLKVVFFVHTSGQVYLWSHVARALERNGHETIFVARGNESICSLLDNYGIKYLNYGKVGKTKYEKVLQLPFQFFRLFGSVKQFRPDIVIGTGTLEAWSGALLGRPSIIFDDSEPRHSLERLSWSYTASCILTPACFSKDLGGKQVRFNGYKELAYLHPNYFKPDPAVYQELGLTQKENYIILRFGSFEAVHDVDRKGFSTTDKYQLVDKLRKYARVFISPEGNLPADLEQYKLPIPYHRIHHAYHYAQLLVTDTQTSTTEAAILGTPVVRCNNFVGPNDMSNFIEIEQKYGLIYSFQESDKAIEKALELIQQPDLKEQWAKKRQRLLADKIDVTQFMVEFIEIYPESFRKYHNKSA
jgi:hypothetical protein